MIDYHLERKRGEGDGVRMKLDVQGQGGGRILDVARQGVVLGGLENWTIFIDVICILSLTLTHIPLFP